MTDLTPRNSDATLGGQMPPPIKGAILGGLDGAKQRLASETLSAKLSALTDAFQYGERGIDLAVQALNDPTEEVQRFACRLLRRQGGDLGQQALLQHRPLSCFMTLSDWRFETYNPEIGIVDPENNASVIRMTNSGRSGRSHPNNIYDLRQFKALLKDPKLLELQALVFEIDYNYWDRSHTFGYAIEAICEAKQLMPNLKALFVGDSEGDRAPEFKKSKVSVFDIRPFLEAFPNLEVLQVFGYFGDYDGYTLECSGLHHEHLKTLIIETADITQANIDQICSMDLPALEYFELWFGRNHEYRSALEPLEPILQREVYPNLKYLGLCSSEEVKKLVEQVAHAPLMQQLAILDLKMGILNDSGLAPLLDESLTANLKVLNVSGNDLSEVGLSKLAGQAYQVISADQLPPNEEYYFGDDEEEDYENRVMNRHSALYE